LAHGNNNHVYAFTTKVAQIKKDKSLIKMCTVVNQHTVVNVLRVRLPNCMRAGKPF